MIIPKTGKQLMAIAAAEGKMTYGIPSVAQNGDWICVDTYTHPVGTATIHINATQVMARTWVRGSHSAPSGKKEHIISLKSDSGRCTLEAMREDVKKVMLPKLHHLWGRYMGDTTIPTHGSTDLA
jgi:hypothetical protein